MLITYIEQKSYCVRRMQKPEKDGLWGPFQHSSSSDGASLLYVHGYHMYSRIPDSISNFSNWHSHNCLLYSFTYWLSIHITLFFLKKNMYLVGGQEKVSQCTTEDSGQFEEFSSLRLPPCKFQGSNSGHQDWQQGLSINELSLWLCIPVLTLLSLWWRHIW